MRASTWRSLVMIPDWLPVKLIALPPNSRIAIDSSAIDIRSPAVSNMSSSRRSGFGDTCLASASSSSVVSPIADTTTTTSWPARRVRITRSATSRIRVTSATLEPPYFWTTMDMGTTKSTKSTKTRRSRRARTHDHEGTRTRDLSLSLRVLGVLCGSTRRSPRPAHGRWCRRLSAPGMTSPGLRARRWPARNPTATRYCAGACSATAPTR